MSGSATNTSSETTRPPPEFFERLFETAGLAVFVCDPGGAVRLWNAPGERLLHGRGLARAGVDLAELLPEPDRAALREQIAQVQRTLDPTELRSCIAAADDGAREFAVWITAAQDDAGAVDGVVVWLHDITDRLRVRRATRKSERLSALGAMSGSVAHTYNNLLCSAATSLEYAMNMSTLNATRRALLRTMEAVTRAGELTRQLLAFAQGDYRAADMADLTETLLYYADENEEQFAKRGVRLELEWAPLRMTPLPRERFLVILNNLGSNAVEAMPGGGTLSICLRSLDANHALLSFRDSGPGIPPEHLERLFEPFFTTKSELGMGADQHAGMGLAVAHGLIAELNGTISASNDPAGGARIELILPLAQP